MVESVTAAELRAAYGRTVEERFGHRLALNVPSRNNPKVVALVDRINHDDELYALWLAANVNGYEGSDWDTYLLFGPDATWTSQPTPLRSSGSPVDDQIAALGQAVGPLLAATTSP